MKRQKENKSQRIVIFVEGDTDEVFFKALLEYYKSVSRTELVPCDVCNLKGVTRYTSKLLAKLKNDILPDAKSKNINIRTVCCSYDTDVFEVRNPLIVNWDSIRKSVKRMGVENFIRIGVCSSIEDWILDDMKYEDDPLDGVTTMALGEGALLAGRYRVVRHLGQGGMGSVWLVEDVKLDNKRFAVKTLPAILVSNKRAFRQIKEEALVAIKLAQKEENA